MKLYRMVPDQYGMLFDNPKYAFYKEGLTIEDLLNELGYINISEHAPYLQITTDPLLLADISWQWETGPGIYFFVSPWSCVFIFKAIDSYFSNCSVRIFEYDIPESIIEKSWQGYGYYGGHANKEIKIPIELLEENVTVLHELSPELKEQLNEVSMKMAQESFDILLPEFIEEEKKCNRNYSEEEIMEYKNYWLSKETQDKINELRYKNIGEFFKTDYLTGRSFYITREQKSGIYQNDEPNYDSVISKSNGILSYENLDDYHHDRVNTK